MKHTTVFMVLFFLSTIVCYSQSRQFQKGQTDFNPGIGLISVLGQAVQDADIQTKTIIPPLSATLDFSVSDAISIGGYIGFAKDRLLYTDYYTYTNDDIGSITHVLLGIRGLYHFDISPKMDTYGGLMLGYNAAKVDIDINSVSVNLRGYTYSLLLGGRYRFNEHTGVFLEIGYGVTVITVGMNFRFLSTRFSTPEHIQPNNKPQQLD